MVVTLDSRILTESVLNLGRVALQSRTLCSDKSKWRSGLALWNVVSVEVPLVLTSKDSGHRAGRKFWGELVDPRPPQGLQ